MIPIYMAGSFMSLRYQLRHELFRKPFNTLIVRPLLYHSPLPAHDPVSFLPTVIPTVSSRVCVYRLSPLPKCQFNEGRNFNAVFPESRTSPDMPYGHSYLFIVSMSHDGVKRKPAFIEHLLHRE